MFDCNPDGAGYMFARHGKVTIHKGFMTFSDLWRAIQYERFSESDAVIYHFRISTQAGKTCTMTQPFPLTSEIDYHEFLDLVCNCGVVHNGIIPMTSDPLEKRYSDTSLFIAKYLTRIVNNSDDFRIPEITDIIANLIGHSKLAILEKDGNIYTIGNFTRVNGILLSNTNHLTPRYYCKQTYNYPDYYKLFDELDAAEKII